MVEAVDNEQHVQLMVNGSMEVPEAAARITNDRTLVPLRFISEKMGAQVEWYPQTKEIKIVKEDTKLELQLGNKQIIVNGKTYQMDIAPYVDQERTLVPIRFVSEFLGLNVGWEATQRMVIVSEPVYVYVNGQPLAKSYSTMKYNQQVYLPIFKLADILQVQVEESKDTNTYAFILPQHENEKNENSVYSSSTTNLVNDEIYSNENKERNKDETSENNKDTEQKIVYLPTSEIITIDGIKMAPYEWIDPVLGTSSKWDMENNIVYINRLEGNEEVGENNELNNIPQLLDIMVEQNSFFFELSHANVQHEHFSLENPQRLIVDLPHTVLAEDLVQTPGAGANVIAVDHETVEQIRISQFSHSPFTVRVVFDLKQRSNVSIKKVDKQLQVIIEKRIPLIVIDPGHGGKDPGAVGRISTESKVVLDISLKIIELLEKDPDLRVITTRTDDMYPTLDERVDLANQIKADLFLSVHANANKNSAIGGTETYIFYNADNAFGKIVHQHLIEATGLEDRGLKEAGFKVIKGTEMPAVLIETAFISNTYEEKLLNDPAFQDKVALAMYNAIKEYEFGK